MSGNIVHMCFPQPKNDIYIWRYFELSHFLDFIASKELYFSRSDKFEDPYEMTLLDGNFSDDVLEKIQEEIPVKLRSEVIGNIQKLYDKLRLSMFASCWHQNDYESIAMWKLYAKTKNSIAIRCKYSSLVSVLSDQCYIGKVNYIDYDKDILPLQNIFLPIMHKREEYRYENEIRAVYCDYDVITKKDCIPKKFYKEKVNLDQLINAVYISPGASGFMHNLVSDIVNKYGYSFQVVQSKLFEKPHYSLNNKR